MQTSSISLITTKLQYKEKGVNGELFADDGNGIIGGKGIDYMAQRLNRVCRDLSHWGKKCGLTFNASKTVVPYSPNPMRQEKNMQPKS